MYFLPHHFMFAVSVDDINYSKLKLSAEVKDYTVIRRYEQDTYAESL